MLVINYKGPHASDKTIKGPYASDKTIKAPMLVIKLTDVSFSSSIFLSVKLTLKLTLKLTQTQENS